MATTAFFIEYINRDMFPTVISVFDEDVRFAEGFQGLSVSPVQEQAAQGDSLVLVYEI
jgi:hypothetical protein